MKVIVLGGGVVGLAVAVELAQRKARVVLVERGALGGEASSAAAGILGAQSEATGPGPLERTLVEARELYATWAPSLEQATGLSVGYRVSGALKLALTEDDELSLRRLLDGQRAAGLRAEWLGGQGAHAVEPTVRESVRGAAYFPDDGQVDPPRLVAALTVAAQESGVEVHAPENGRRLLLEGDRCRGVETDRGRLLADAVVLAAGSWASLVPGVPSAVQVRPVRGQMLELREVRPALRTVLVGPGAYAVPRGEGRVVCGSTMEDVGHAPGVTAAGLRKILDGVLAYAPELGAATVERTWSGFRPASSTGLPLVGPSPLPGLFLATGHHRNGILLARWTALQIAASALGG